MCGIAGIVKEKGSKIAYASIKRFTDSIAHRGPDGADYKLLNNDSVALGHRRLSILDLSTAGTQPMTWQSRYTITYNGEVYNFIELKTELERDGFKFKTETDTEIILAAFQKWGNDCFQKFNGMWAIAIFDSETKCLTLCRDRFGVKPLYYTYKKNKFFAFASETIAFASLNDFERKINEDVLMHAIQSPNLIEPSGYTLYQNVYQLPAGCLIELNAQVELKQIRWWDTFKNLKKPAHDFQGQVEEFKSLFLDACKIRLRSDVPLASALSGGVDSSSVYCMIHHLMKKNSDTQRIATTWQKAFVATFPGTTQDERAYAEQVIEYTKGEVKYIEPDYSNLTNDIISSTIKFDSITGTPIAVVANVYKAMRENGIIVSMDGHGADELMYGYRASVAEAFYDTYISNSASGREDVLNTYLNLFPVELRTEAKNKLLNKAELIGNFENSQKTFLGSLKKQVKNIAGNNANGSILKKANLTQWFNNKQIPGLTEINNSSYKFPLLSRGELKLAEDFHNTSIPYNLRDFDRASMQHGIEIRMPFMDYRLVSYLFSLPQTSKLGKGYTKLILREGMKGLMPETIRTRKLKIGLSAPLTNWFNGALGEFIVDTVNSQNFIKSPYWNGELVKDFVVNKTKSKNWRDGESENFWNILNAHILLSNAN